MNKDFSKANKQLFLKLNPILKKEKIVLRYAEWKTSKNTQTNLKRAIKLLKNRMEDVEKKKVSEYYNRTWTDELNITYKSRKIEFSVKKLKKFLKHMLTFLEITDKDLNTIKGRIELEEELINKEATSENFKKFIEVWESEINANKKAVKHFNKAYWHNLSMIREIDTMWDRLGVGLKLASVAIFVGAKEFIQGQPGIHEDLYHWLVISAMAILLTGFITEVTAVSKQELVYLAKDKDLLKKIDNARYGARWI